MDTFIEAIIYGRTRIVCVDSELDESKLMQRRFEGIGDEGSGGKGILNSYTRA